MLNTQDLLTYITRRTALHVEPPTIFRGFDSRYRILLTHSVSITYIKNAAERLTAATTALEPSCMLTITNTEHRS